MEDRASPIALASSYPLVHFALWAMRTHRGGASLTFNASQVKCKRFLCYKCRQKCDKTYNLQVCQRHDTEETG